MTQIEDTSMHASLPFARHILSHHINLEGIPLEVLADKYDATWYQQRKTFEEKVSLLYRFIRDERFVQFVDVGANVGLISILAHRAAPQLHCIALEADPRLAELMRRNFSHLGLDNIQIINAIVGMEQQASTAFSLDNRVNIDGWEKTFLPMVTLDQVLNEHGITGKTFFKIDTQGFEYHVLRGCESWLRQHHDWIIKMEFAPNWLQSQGTDPLALLAWLQDECDFEIAEFTERIPFGTPGIDALFSYPVTQDEREAFLAHVISLNKDGLGWVDLLVRPRPER
ncbi:FkbM family methyltransferase [Methylobacillus gramineus]|uniref:FkbM family methyltransferase n=1 Tax=Methylobacillus gramineus TaxID=755169 RepID=UPI001CFF8473|nr:FkbM family methyltransferase [Methylobacillus gramineus]MCB5185798.1 FkbM family methyltransferase [Methylobacillus gramineus]